jgi:hypothetical protein
MTAPRTDLTQMTPIQIDTELAELALQRLRAEQLRDARANTIFSYAGRRESVRGNRNSEARHVNHGTFDEARELVECWVAAFEASIAAGDRYDDMSEDARNGIRLAEFAPKYLAQYDAADAEIAQITERESEISTEWCRRDGWTRKWLVTSSAGHLHSSENCPTCRLTTTFALWPDLSGLTEAEAIAALGRYADSLCSVCFPTAPVATNRTNISKAQALKIAEGGFIAEIEDDRKCTNTDGINHGWIGRGLYADCDACGARGVTCTNRGNLRKHSHERNVVNAQRAARLTDPLLIGTRAGDELKVRGDVISTVRTAEIAYVDAMYWAASATRNRPDYPDLAARYLADAAVLVEALAAKWETTVDEARARLAARVAKKTRGI